MDLFQGMTPKSWNQLLPSLFRQAKLVFVSLMVLKVPGGHRIVLWCFGKHWGLQGIPRREEQPSIFCASQSISHRRAEVPLHPAITRPGVCV